MKIVTAAILLDDDKVLIAKRKATDTLPGKWEFPGGKVKLGETLEECLKREIKEELDLDVEIGSLFGESTYAYSHGTIRLVAFYVFCDRRNITARSHEEVRWANINELDHFDFAPADLPFVRKLWGDR